MSRSLVKKNQRVDKKFPCPLCGDKETFVRTSIRPHKKGNGRHYKRYRECGSCGNFLTYATSKTSNDERFIKFANGKQNGQINSKQKPVRQFGKISKELLAEITRTKYPPDYFTKNGKGKNDKSR